jgi:hypothetical protein
MWQVLLDDRDGAAADPLRTTMLYYGQVGILADALADFAETSDGERRISERKNFYADLGIQQVKVNASLMASAAAPLMAALAKMGGEFRRLRGFDKGAYWPHVGRRISLSRGWVPGELIECLTDGGLGYFRNTAHFFAECSLRTSEVIGQIYWFNLIAEASRATGMRHVAFSSPPPLSSAISKEDCLKLLQDSCHPCSCASGSVIQGGVRQTDSGASRDIAGYACGDIRCVQNGSASIRSYEAVSASIAIAAVLPRNLHDLPLRELVAFKEKHQDELRRYREHVAGLLEREDVQEAVMSAGPHKVQDVLTGIYETETKPILLELDRALKSNKIDTLWSAVSVESLAPPALAAAVQETLQFGATASALMVGSGIALGLGKVVRESGTSRRQIKAESEVAYLHSLGKVSPRSHLDWARRLPGRRDAD